MGKLYSELAGITSRKTMTILDSWGWGGAVTSAKMRNVGNEKPLIGNSSVQEYTKTIAAPESGVVGVTTTMPL